jgi:hypothetical protein
VPSIGARGLGAYDVRFGDHLYAAAAKRPIDQSDFYFDGRAGFDALGTKKKHTARADISRAQPNGVGLALPGDARDAQRQSQMGARVCAAFIRDADGVRGNAPNAARPGAFDPLRRVGRGRGAGCAQTCAGGLGIAGRCLDVAQ